MFLRAGLKDISECFYFKIFIYVEPSCVNGLMGEIWILSGMLVHSSVGIETHFGQLRPYLEILND